MSTNFGSEPWLIEIGNNVGIAGSVTFVTHDASGWLVRDDHGRRFRYGRIVVGNDVLIGLGSILHPGVKIGDRVVIAAGSVVTKSIPSGSVVGGNPVKYIASFDDFESYVLGHWASEDDMKGTDFRSRVDSIVEERFSPYLQKERKPSRPS